MKKCGNIIIWMTAAVMLSASCEHYIDLRDAGPEKLLVVNGNLISGDTLHTVFLSWSMFDDVKPVKSAHIDLYVNGKIVASSDEVKEPDRYASYAGEVKLSASFRPGDEVRIAVDADDAHAETVSVAPDVPVINAVDTSAFEAKDKNGDIVDWYMTRVSLRDISGESNYYRILMSVESEFRASHVAPDSGYKDGQFLCNVSSNVDFDNTYESLLYRKLNIGMDDNSDDSDNYYANKYNLFTDNPFADGEYTLKLAVRKWSLYNSYPDSWSSDKFRPAESRSLRVRVLSMSRSTYNYMNDYAFDKSDQGDWTFIGGIPYPSNVTGGTGMVSVMSPADYEILLK